MEIPEHSLIFLAQLLSLCKPINGHNQKVKVIGHRDRAGGSGVQGDKCASYHKKGNISDAVTAT